MMNKEINKKALEINELEQVSGGGLLDRFELGDVFGLPFGKKAIEKHNEKMALEKMQRNEEEVEEEENNSIFNTSAFKTRLHY